MVRDREEPSRSDCLAGAVRNGRGGEIDLGIRDELGHVLSIALKGFETYVPRSRARRRRLLRPVAGRPLRGDVLGIAGKLKDVPLDDPHVLKLPLPLCGYTPLLVFGRAVRRGSLREQLSSPDERHAREEAFGDVREQLFRPLGIL